MLAYTVHAECPTSALADDFAAWMRTHMPHLLAAGAVRADLVRLDPVAQSGPVRFEARYLFPSREAFATYERDHAPKLRADGMARFPPSSGLKLTRTVGTLTQSHARTPA